MSNLISFKQSENLNIIQQIGLNPTQEAILIKELSKTMKSGKPLNNPILGTEKEDPNLGELIQIKQLMVLIH